MWPNKPLSVRLNNPGNLRRTGIAWRGLIPDAQLNPDQKAHYGYCAFLTPPDGWRALAVDVHTKWAKDGLRTIRAIITKYAPEEENDTGAYIKAMCDMVGAEPDAQLDLGDEKQLTSFCRAISVHEGGGWFWDTDDLADGVRMALAFA